MLVRAVGAAVGLAGVATIGVHAHLTPDGRAANDAFLIAVSGSRARPWGSPVTGAPGTRTHCSSVPGCSPSRCKRSCSTRTGSCPIRPPWEGHLVPGARMVHRLDRRRRRFVLARPWWDRRGRRRIRPGSSSGRRPRRWPCRTLLLSRSAIRSPHVKNVDLRRDGAFALTSPALWLVGLASRSSLLVSRGVEGVRIRRGDIRTPRPWLAAAWLLAIGGQVVLLARPVLPTARDPGGCASSPICIGLRSWGSSPRNAPRPPGRGAPPTGRRRSWEAGPRSPP